MEETRVCPSQGGAGGRGDGAGGREGALSEPPLTGRPNSSSEKNLYQGSFSRSISSGFNTYIWRRRGREKRRDMKEGGRKRDEERREGRNKAQRGERESEERERDREREVRLRGSSRVAVVHKKTFKQI